MKKVFAVTLVVAVITFLGGFFTSAFAAEDLLGPSTSPSVTQMQNDILITDKVMAETRTFRYGFCVVFGLFVGVG